MFVNGQKIKEKFRIQNIQDKDRTSTRPENYGHTRTNKLIQTQKEITWPDMFFLYMVFENVIRLINL